MPGIGEVPIVASVGGVQLRWHARELRGERSLADAARLTGINRDELSRIEKGQTVQIRFETLAKLVDGYECDLSELLEVAPAHQPEAAPPWAGPLKALREGWVRAGVPGRAEPDTRGDTDVLSDALEQHFEESEVAGVRRGAFRPAGPGRR